VLKAAADSGLSVFVPFLRKDESRREVHGVIADETPDKSNEVFDYQSSKPHFQTWVNEAVERTASAGQPISYGNVRGQHSNVAAGKLSDVSFDDQGKKISVIAKVVDDDAWRKVLEGVYTGFSIGGKYLKKWGDGSNVRYTAKPAEVSLVDSPCNPSATFTAIKSAPAEVNEPTLLDQIRELVKQVDARLARRSETLVDSHIAPHNEEKSRFVPRDSYDPDLVGINAHMKVPKSSDVRGEINKAFANGVDPRQHGSDIPRTFSSRADEELHKALSNGRPAAHAADNPFEK
jgi:hypothetical protein